MKGKQKGTDASRAVSDYLADIGRKGGKASARKLTKAQRSARARMAVQAREAKRKGGRR
jgi:hypothetical protein